MKDFFKDVLDRSVNLGDQLLQREISDHGNEIVDTRPDQKVIVQMPEKNWYAGKELLLVGGGLVLTVAVLAIIARK